MGVEIDGELPPGTPMDGADAVVEQSSPAAEAPAESSTAEGETDAGLLSVVRNAVAKGKPDGVAASPAAESDDPNESEDASADDGTSDDPKKDAKDGDEKVPFHKHPRFQELVRQRDELKKPAEDYGKLQQWLAENSLSGEEAFNGLSMVALAKRDPAKAWEQIKPFVQDLALRAGAVLPPDLAQKVREGTLPRDAALELSRSRALIASADTRREQEQAAREQAQQETAARSLQAEAATWESEVRATDVDFAAKQEALVREVVYLQKVEGVPDTPEGVRKQLDAAHRAVTKRLAATQPARRMMQPIGGGRANGTTRAAPQSMLDVVKQTLGSA